MTKAHQHEVVDQIRELFQMRGSSMYGGEAVTQMEHGLQAAMLAECSGADADLITSALLHDVGHLLHDLSENGPEEGIDDAHEELAYEWLSQYFPPEVYVPVQCHVLAKRYLCTVDPDYQATLSEPSLLSLELQGGKLSAKEVAETEANPHFESIIELRRWDDLAKVSGLPTPTLEHFLGYVSECLSKKMHAENLL